jgi:hypothetical protein
MPGGCPQSVHMTLRTDGGASLGVEIDGESDGAQTSLSSSSITNLFDSAPIVLLLLALRSEIILPSPERQENAPNT